MGIDTGANKKYRITEENEVVFEDFYDDIEGEYLKYPNAEFVELANTLKVVSEGKINLRMHYLYIIYAVITDSAVSLYFVTIFIASPFSFKLKQVDKLQVIIDYSSIADLGISIY